MDQKIHFDFGESKITGAQKYRNNAFFLASEDGGFTLDRGHSIIFDTYVIQVKVTKYITEHIIKLSHLHLFRKEPSTSTTTTTTTTTTEAPLEEEEEEIEETQSEEDPQTIKQLIDLIKKLGKKYYRLLV